MIVVVTGDLLQMAKDGEFYAIVHGCNCFNTMGSGIAKSIKREFPEAYEADQCTTYGDITKLGNFTFATTSYGFDVINVYTQYRYGTDRPHIDYEALALCLRKINHLYKGEKIGLPRIGAGLAGGDWKKIRSIIENELTDVYATVVEYKPN